MHTSLAPVPAVDDQPASARSMRVAFVTETYPPEVNGVATTTLRFVEGLRRRRHAVQLVRPRQSAAEIATVEPPFEEVLMRGVPIPRYSHLRMGVPSRRALVDLWSRRRPDVVHVATEGPLGWSALQAARRLEIPVTSDFRTNFQAYSRHYGIGWLRRPIVAYLRAFHNRCACTMVPTEALRHDLRDAGFERLGVVARGVDTDRYTPSRRSEALRASWGVAPGDLVVGYVGRLAPEKNLGTLMAAFAAIRAIHPRARLVLVGEGPQRVELRARCPDAVFAGLRHGDDLAAHYASFDQFLFPSMTETFGNVTTEALASGLPIVAFDHAAAGQLIQSGHNGVLSPFGDDAAFVRAAVALAGHPEPRHAIGARARATASALSWDTVVAQFESHLLAARDEATDASLAAVVAARHRLA